MKEVKTVLPQTSNVQLPIPGLLTLKIGLIVIRMMKVVLSWLNNMHLAAYILTSHTALKQDHDWNKVKEAFLEIYPEEHSLPSLMHELSSMTRKPIETLTELYIRIEGICYLNQWSPTFFAPRIGLMSANIFTDRPLRCGG